MSPPDLQAMLGAEHPPQVIDVRRRDIFDADAHIIPGSVWRDMDAVTEWSGRLESDRTVVVICLHGHERSQNTAARLRALGFDARWLEAGFEGWVQAGLPLARKAGGDAA